ncbi:MAG: NfeD family protein [Patescibacteria group bacterium]
MSDTPHILLIVLGIVAIVVEILLGAVTGFELFILGLILIISGTTGLISGSLLYGGIVFIVLTLLYVFLGRQYLKNSFAIGTKKTNVDSLIGARGIVTKEVSPEVAGHVRVHDEVWRATSSKKLSKGTAVTVESVSGVTVTVS